MAVPDAMELTDNLERRAYATFNVKLGKFLPQGCWYIRVNPNYSSSSNDAAEIMDLKEQVDRLTKVVDQLTVEVLYLFYDVTMQTNDKKKSIYDVIKPYFDLMTSLRPYL